MIKSKEIAGPSCLTRARDDEPIFVLRANDELAPITVNFWATQYFKQKNRQSGGITTKQREKHFEAVRLADDMHRWRQRNATAQISNMTGVPVERVEKILVNGEVKLDEPPQVEGILFVVGQPGPWGGLFSAETLEAMADGVTKFFDVPKQALVYRGPMPPAAPPAEPRRVGGEVMSGCAVRAAAQIERAEKAQTAEDVMINVCKLASELCNAIDAAEEDIGGHRPVAEILKELGPACDRFEGR